MGRPGKTNLALWGPTMNSSSEIFRKIGASLGMGGVAGGNGYQQPADHHIFAAQHLVKRFGGVVAVNDMSVAVKPHAIHGLIGPNGSGKTTTINLLSGHLRPGSGAVWFKGRRIDSKPAHERAKAGVIRTFQVSSIFPELTVLQNVLVGCFRLGKAGLIDATILQWRDKNEREQLTETARAAIAKLNLSRDEDRLGRYLSYGRQKMVDMARALAANPEVLLLDEPAAGLTSTEIGALTELLRELQAERRTLILTEHHMKMVMGICNEITVMNFGAEIASGTPEEIRAHQDVIEAYLGRGGKVARS